MGIDVNSVISAIARRRSNDRAGRGNFGVYKPSHEDNENAGFKGKLGNIDFGGILKAGLTPQDDGYISNVSGKATGAVWNPQNRTETSQWAQMLPGIVNGLASRFMKSDDETAVNEGMPAHGMRGLKKGGILRPGEMALVGDGGDGDPSDDEVAVALPQGGVAVVPSEMDMKSGKVPWPKIKNSQPTFDPNKPLNQRPVTEGNAGTFQDPDYAEIQERSARDYSKKKNPNFNANLPESDTNTRYVYGKDRQMKNGKYQNHGGWKDILKTAGLGALQGAAGAKDMSQLLGGLIGGAAAGGVAGRVDPNSDEKIVNDIRLQQAQERYGRTQTIKAKDAQIENIKEDNRRARESAEELRQWRRAEWLRKTDATEGRERTARMNAVAGMFKNIPAYDPNDPKFKELTTALGDVGLPITPKDAKKKVDLKQDQRTGAWTVILTDPISGRQEVRNVIKDGKPFTSTPTVVMQGEYGMLKQNDQQEFQQEENNKNRVQALRIARERIQIARDQLVLAQQRFEHAQGQDKIDAENDLKRIKQAQLRLKLFLKNNPLISDDADLLQELNAIEE